jgi:hypothetical protein
MLFEQSIIVFESVRLCPNFIEENHAPKTRLREIEAFLPEIMKYYRGK